MLGGEKDSASGQTASGEVQQGANAAPPNSDGWAPRDKVIEVLTDHTKVSRLV